MLNSHECRLGLALLFIAVTSFAAGCGGGGGGLTGQETATAHGGSDLLKIQATDIDGDDAIDLIVTGANGVHTCLGARPDGEFEERPDWEGDPGVADLFDREAVALLADLPFEIHADATSVLGEDLAPVVTLFESPEVEAPVGPPKIRAIVPSHTRPGALVLIIGRNFKENGVRTTCTVAGISAPVYLALPRFVVVRVPRSVPTGVQRVVVSRGDVASDPFPLTIIGDPTPAIDFVLPKPLVQGRIGLVKGKHLGTFGDDVVMRIGDVRVRRLLPLGELIVFRVPREAESGDLVVRVNGVSSAPYPVRVVSHIPGPELKELVPEEAPVGNLVRIRGENLWAIGELPDVYVGRMAMPIYEYGSESLTVIVPWGARSNDVIVIRGGHTSNALPLEVRERKEPHIRAIEPEAGPVGTVVEILGTDLFDLSGDVHPGPVLAAANAKVLSFREEIDRPSYSPGRVLFGDVEAPAFPIWGGWLAIVPFGLQPGSVAVTVEVRGRTSNAVRFVIEEGTAGPNFGGDDE